MRTQMFKCCMRSPPFPLMSEGIKSFITEYEFVSRVIGVLSHRVCLCVLLLICFMII